MKVAAGGVAFVIVVLSLMSAQFASAGSDEVEKAPPFNIFYGGQNAHRVTVKSEGGTTVVLEFPQGVLVGLRIPQHGNPSMPGAPTLPNTFQGDIEVRARREDELSPDESTSAIDIMAKAPVILELEGVVIDVERVEEP